MTCVLAPCHEHGVGSQELPALVPVQMHGVNRRLLNYVCMQCVHVAPRPWPEHAEVASCASGAKQPQAQDK